jgi:SAM-dependent methyltransferase
MRRAVSVSIVNATLAAIVERYARGEVSAQVATMELLLASKDVGVLTRDLAMLSEAEASVVYREQVLELSRWVSEHEDGCVTITQMLRTGLDMPDGAPVAEVAIAQSRRLFDYSVRVSPESSVALYSLGSAELLAQATAEVVAVFEAWRLLGPERDALEIGCGIGRILEPLAKRARRVVGIDIASNMLEVARSRLLSVTNVELRLTSGHDLRDFADDSFDLVYSVDAFPYLVRGGVELVARHFHEVARVLRPGGDFVIFNYAYGRPRADDAREVRALGTAANLSVVRSDVMPFELWNGIGFHLQKP